VLANEARHWISLTAFKRHSSESGPVVTQDGTSLIRLKEVSKQSKTHCEDVMTEPIGSNQSRFVATINKAIDIAEIGQLSQALQLLTDLAAEFPEAASVRGYLAWYLLQLGRQKEAIEQSRQAIGLAPKSERASLIHFHTLWKAGKYIEALDEMKRFLTIRPSEEYSRIIKEWEPNLGRP
jgi:predicted Zn-dependent protease